jgi:hypothetical protein
MNFLEEFQTRRGYDLTPFFLYVLQDDVTFSGNETTKTQITNDFYQTVSDLYSGYRMTGFKNWANSLGLKLRVQPYTVSFDSSYAASIVDIPEGETLDFTGADDSFRVLAAGRDIGGKTTILSNELGATFDKAYGASWKYLLSLANHVMALGVSQSVIHGYAYRDSPSSVWPGFAPFTPFIEGTGFADLWGSRQPQWMFASSISSYMARGQMLLQQSGPSTDVAILNQAWGVTASWNDSSLNDAGYTYQFPTPALLRSHNITVSGQRLASDGPAYKALIIDNAELMDVETAEAILAYGQNGLPIVVVGATPSATFSYSTSDNVLSQLQETFDQIRNLSTTASVDTEADAPDALATLGVESSVQYSSNTNNALITIKRTMDSGYFYWVYNNGEDTRSSTLSFEGTGAPYLVDLWTGDVAPFAAFTASDSRVSVNVTLTSASVLAILSVTLPPHQSQEVLLTVR